MTYQRLEELARRPGTGVSMRAGTVLSRRPDVEASWTGVVPRHERLEASQLPESVRAAAAVAGIRCTVPLAQTDSYLRWLGAAVREAGARVHTLQVRDLQQVLDITACEALVVAAGMRSAALLGDDDQVFPIRGQVVRVANPGLSEWITDDDNPAGLTYVVPRGADVVCGGTGEVGCWDERVDPRVEQAILERACALVPSLRGQPVLSRAVGLRPARSSVRVEAVAGHAVPVFACYGHGGAGFTLSWGDAQHIAGLVAAL